MKTLAYLLFCLLAALSAQAATITLAPGDDAVAAFTASSAGDTIVFTGSTPTGIYRRNNMTPKDNQTIILFSNVKLMGSDLLTSWTQDGDLWYASGQTQGTSNVAGQCQTGYRCTKQNELFVDDVPWDHKESLVEVVKEGQWFFDYDADRIYMFGDPTGRVVETSISGQAFKGTANNVTINCRGATIEKYATPAQQGAIGGNETADPGTGWRVLGCNIRHIHGIAIKSGTDWEVRDNILCDNGQLGAGGNGSNAYWSGNTLCRNNYARFQAGWEAGGSKFANSTGYRFVRGKVYRNNGPGLWFDVENANTLVEGVEIYENTHEGLKYEISDGLIARYNNIYNNGVIFHSWLLGGQIHLQNSEGSLVERNTLTAPYGTTTDAIDGPHGVMITCQDRPNSTCNNNIVQDNIITMTSNRGLSGAGDDWTEPAGFYTTNIFRRNTYRVLDAATDHFHWSGGLLNFSEWIAATGEVGATLKIINEND